MPWTLAIDLPLTVQYFHQGNKTLRRIAGWSREKMCMCMCAHSPAGRGKLLRFCMLFTTCLFQNTEFSLLCSSAVTLYHIDVQMGNTRAISASPFESDTEAEWNCGLTASIQVMFLFLKWAVWDLLFAVWVRRCLREKVILCQFNK